MIGRREVMALVDGAKSIGINMDEEKIEMFLQYERILEEWSERINLVRFRDREELYRSHFLDSLCCAKGAELCEGVRFIDIGSGAGFPGIPLKICFPETTVYLLESQKKKCMFLEAVVEKLGLKECFVVNKRAEVYAREEGRSSFDVVVSRAVASVAVLLEL
ncbi:MAG: 16S rRNA (guanine(527)-N(7))-methyltransferase RsmG, partial [Thermacetogeniaceae bacterium]